MDDKLKSDEILEKLKGMKDRDQQVQVEEDTVQLIIFSLHETLYAFPADDAIEIDDNQKVYKVPGTPSFVKGVKNLRGDITSVLCLRTLMEIPVDEQKPGKRIVYFYIDDNALGLIVDMVVDVIDFPISGIKKTMVALDRLKKDLVQGELAYNEQHVLLLDVHKIYDKAVSNLSGLG